MDLIEFKKIEKNQRHPWEMARGESIKKLVFSNSSLITEDIKVLDVGAGDGWLSNQLMNLGNLKKLALVDSEYSPPIIEKLRTSFQSDDRAHFYNDLPDEKFDLILMLDVLEHIKEDKDFLQKVVHNNAREGSMLLLTVPCYQFLYTQHDKMLNHVRRYSPKDFVNLVRDENLKIISYGGFFVSLLPIRILEKLRDVLSGSANQDQTLGLEWKQGRFLTKLLTLMLQADFKICFWLSRMGIKMPGLSWWCLCKK